MATGNNKNLDKLMNKINTETGRSDAEEILRLQAQRQLKSEHKKVSQMTDFEKQLFAEMEQKTVEKYEEKFLSDKPVNYITSHTNHIYYGKVSMFHCFENRKKFFSYQNFIIIPKQTY